MGSPRRRPYGLYALIFALLILAVVRLFWRREEPGVSSRAAAPAAPTAAPQPIAAAPAPSAAPPEDAQSGPPRVTVQAAPELAAGELCGRVVSSATFEPIWGAEVTFGSPRGASSVRSDTSGAFCFAPEQPGVYQVASVTAAGFLPFGPEWGKSPLSATSQRGVRVKDLLISLGPSAQLLVTVQDAKGARVGGAALRLLTPRAGEVALYPAKDRFTADAQGEARLTAAVETVVEAWHPMRGRGREEVDAQALREGRLTIVLQPGAVQANAALSGRVLDPQGSGAAGALVLASSSARAYPKVFGDRDGYRVLCDEEGRFALAELEPGLYDLSAHLQGASPARRFDVKVPAAGLELRLSSGAALVGKVSDARGAPVPAFALALEWKKAPMERLEVLESTVVNPSGEYRVEGVAPGSYVLRVTGAGYAPREQLVEVAPDAREVRADATLEAGATLSGTVTSSAGGPLAGARVRAESLASLGALAPELDAVSAADGRFELRGLPTAPLSVHASAPGHNARVLANVRAGTPLLVQLTAIAPDAGQRLEMVGIGAVLKGREDALVIGEVLPGGGAGLAGLVPGDEVVAVDGQLVTALGFGPSINAIRGEAESTVVLRVRKGGHPPPVEVNVQRRKIGA